MLGSQSAPGPVGPCCLASRPVYPAARGQFGPVPTRSAITKFEALIAHRSARPASGLTCTHVWIALLDPLRPWYLRGEAMVHVPTPNEHAACIAIDRACVSGLVPAWTSWVTRPIAPLRLAMHTLTAPWAHGLFQRLLPCVRTLRPSTLRTAKVVVWRA